MLYALGNLYARLFGRAMFSKLNAALFYVSARGLGLHNYANIAQSGELWVINKFIGSLKRPVILDVGANDGSWIESVLSVTDSAVIHAFEPQERLAVQLQNSFPKVSVNSVAVGKQEGRLELFNDPDKPGSEHATLVVGVFEGIHNISPEQKTVNVISLDQYCRKKDLQKVHFLKIDVEGNEYNVLLGAKNILETGVVDMVQLEFNEMNIHSRVLFKDIFDLLNRQFKLYRLLPSGLLEIKSYKPWSCEQFVYQNVLAIRR